ncbi:MAG: MarR family transcriptional regulator [Acidimicrobiia bacterium]
MTLEKFETVQLNLTRLVRQVSIPRFHQRVLARAGVEIDRVEAIALSRIVEAGSLRLSDLADQLGVACSTAGRHAAHLEGRDLVTRSVDPSDGRAVMVEPTREGMRLVGHLRQAYRELLSEAMADWEPEEIESLTALLGRLAGGLARLSVEVAV